MRVGQEHPETLPTKRLVGAGGVAPSIRTQGMTVRSDLCEAVPRRGLRHRRQNTKRMLLQQSVRTFPRHLHGVRVPRRFRLR